MSFFEELKRRNVFRVGVAYLISAWVLLQVVDLVLENIQAPEWVMKVFMLAMAIGFPLAVFFAWAFEMTPDGIKKEKDVDRSQSITSQTGHKLDRSIIVVLIIAVIYFAWGNFSPAPSVSQTAPVTTPQAATLEYAPKSIAVLPFADLSQARDQEWFADGLAEEILNALAKTPDLLVSSRTSSFRYKDSTLDLPDIARELGVAHILEGSVRSSGNRIRVTAQLIRASDGFHLWSENYDRDIADMIEIQEDLALNIAKALETTMDPVALAAMIDTGTRSVEAYEAYLRGLSTRQKSLNSAASEALFEKAYQHFELARSIDPNFAVAHLEASNFWETQLSPTRIASGLTDLAPHQLLFEFNQRIDLAIANATTTIDKKRYVAYKALVELRLAEATRLYREYLEERPNDVSARFALGVTAGFSSNSDLRKETLEFWRERGASDVFAAFLYMNDAYTVVDPSQAADFGIKALQRWPNHNGLMYQTHRTLMWAGRILEGRELADRYSRLFPGEDALVRARQACAEGRRTDAQDIYDSLDPNNNYERSSRWHILKLLGKEQQAVGVLLPYTESGIPYMMGSWLIYRSFDPAPFPALLAVLDREGISRPPARDIPFKCPPPEQTSIAVLPFVNMSTDADNEFFSDGIAEEILNVLASIPDLKVAARTSAFAYKGTNTNISRIADELGVNHILEGSVRKSGNQVRVTAQLIKADDGFHLWSANYDRELTNIFAIQDEIAGSIADALKVSLELESGTTGNLTGTNSIEAYEHYLKGMSLWHMRTVNSLREAIEEFEAATALDPQFPKAYAGLALTWGVIDGYVTMDSKATMAEASKAANMALSLDENNVEAITALAQHAMRQGKYAESFRLYQRAIALNPSFATAHQWLGGLLGEMGDPEAGLVSYQKAWSLDPRARIIGANLAMELSNHGRNQEAIDTLIQITGFAPEFPDAYEQLMHISIITGDCAGASRYGEQLAKILNKQPDTVQPYLDLCQTTDLTLRSSAITTIAGWPDTEFSDPDSPSLSYPAELVGLLVELGEFDATIGLIEKFLISNPGPGLVSMFRSKRTENGIAFYCDPRLQAIYKQVGMPEVEGENICD